ncbi:MAG: histidinol-phosphate transaminase [Fimbriimonadaceae bacterium]|nr:histidinol-phosphate transaminase [Fimbriimonadaceae bacterium]
MALPIRKNILAMAPYSPGKPIDEVRRELGVEEVIKLASNENPLGPSPKAVQAMAQALTQLHLYPDAACFELKKVLCERFGVSPEQLLIGNGSDELIRMIGWVLIDSPEDEIITGDPSFVVYNHVAEEAPCKLIRIPVDSGLRIDLKAMAKAVTDNTKIVFIANPNNPTGTMVGKSEVDAFLSDVPSTVCVVLDEAYFEFAAGEPNYPNSLEYLKNGHNNVVGLRTFSKAYGLAGIRCGYGWASAELADALNRCRPPFNVNSLAQAAAIAALEDDEHLVKTLENNHQGATRMADAFRSVGATPYPTHANFILADMHTPAGPIFQAMLKQGVIVRSGEALGLPTFLRVSIGSDHEVDAFIEALHSTVHREVRA